MGVLPAPSKFCTPQLEPPVNCPPPARLKRLGAVRGELPRARRRRLLSELRFGRELSANLNGKQMLLTQHCLFSQLPDRN